MPTFYFDILVNAEKSADVNGIELASAEEAHKLALEDIGILPGTAAATRAHHTACSRFSTRTAIFSSGFRFYDRHMTMKRSGSSMAR